MALQSWLSLPRLDYGQFWQEPAITQLDWLFTPSPRLEEHLPVAPLQASTKFYLHFTLPWVRSPGFWSYPSDFGNNTMSLASCGHLLSLRLPFRLTLPLRHTPWHVILNARYSSEEQYQTMAIRFQGLFTPISGFFSAFLHSTGKLSDFSSV